MAISPSSSVQLARQGLAGRLRDLRLDAGLSGRALSAGAGGFPDMGTALAAHRVDAAFITEPSLSAAEIGQGVQPLFDVDSGPTANIPISGYVTTETWAEKYPRTGAAFTEALVRGQRVAGTTRTAVEQALTPALHLSKTTAAVMALGTPSARCAGGLTPMARAAARRLRPECLEQGSSCEIASGPVLSLPDTSGGERHAGDLPTVPRLACGPPTTATRVD